jgi:ribonuclease E
MEEGFVASDEAQGSSPSDDASPVQEQAAQAATPPQAEPESPRPAASEGERIVAPSQPVAQPAEEPAPAPVIPEPEPVAVVLTPPDPERPKRAGWWSKAKSVLSGS